LTVRYYNNMYPKLHNAEIVNTNLKRLRLFNLFLIPFLIFYIVLSFLSDTLLESSYIYYYRINDAALLLINVLSLYFLYFAKNSSFATKKWFTLLYITSIVTWSVLTSVVEYNTYGLVTFIIAYFTIFYFILIPPIVISTLSIYSLAMFLFFSWWIHSTIEGIEPLLLIIIPFLILTFIVSRNTYLSKIKSLDLKSKLQKTNDEITVSKTKLEQEIRSREYQIRRATRKLREREKKFGLYVNNLNDLIYELNPQGKFIFVSDNVKDLLGYEPQEILNTKFDEIVHPNDVHFCYDFLNKVLQSKEKQAGIKYRVRHKEDGWKYHISNGSPLINEKNNQTTFVGVARDVTEKHKNEVSLKEKEFRYRKLFENMQNGVAIYRAVNDGADFEFVAFNSAAERITNTKFEELYGKTLLQEFPNMRNAPLYKALQEVHLTGKEKHLEPFYYDDNKRNGWRENFIYKLPGYEIVAIFNDVTQQIEYEKQLKEHNKILQEAMLKAEESDKLKTEFLNNMSHEVRTPMNGILGFTTLINKPGIDDSKKSYYIQIISKCTKDLLRIMENIIDISTLVSGNARVDSNRIMLGELITDIFNKFSPIVREKNLAFYLQFNCPGKLGHIIVDTTKLEKTINNLLDNAIKFTHKGYILLGARIEEQKLYITVKDTGIGIDEKDQPNIFKNFEQLNKGLKRPYGGLGLGLSVVHHNLRLLKGTISIDSRKENGAVFELQIPVYTVKNNAHKLKTMEQKPCVKNYTILSCNAEANIDTTVKLPEKHGESIININILKAQTLNECHTIMDENPFINLLLVTSSNLYETNQLCEKIKTKCQACHILVVYQNPSDNIIQKNDFPNLDTITGSIPNREELLAVLAKIGNAAFEKIKII